MGARLFVNIIMFVRSLLFHWFSYVWIDSAAVKNYWWSWKGETNALADSLGDYLPGGDDTAYYRYCRRNKIKFTVICIFFWDYLHNIQLRTFNKYCIISCISHHQFHVISRKSIKNWYSSFVLQYNIYLFRLCRNDVYIIILKWLNGNKWPEATKGMSLLFIMKMNLGYRLASQGYVHFLAANTTKCTGY